MTKEEKWIDNFWRNHITTAEDCWEWLGYRMPSGYGHRYLPFLKKYHYTHRIAHWLTHNRTFPPKEMVVMHSCDNPPCYNPKHLKLGTYGDNTRDSVSKGRFQSKRPRKNHVPVTHCIHGHEYTPQNTYWYKSTTSDAVYRACKICNLDSVHKRRSKI